MNECLEACLITSAPFEIQLALCEFFLATATILFCLSAEAVHYPLARESLAQYLRGDYWIARQRRKHLAYTQTVGLLCMKPRSAADREPRKRAGRASGPQAPRGIHPYHCVGHG